MIYTTRYNHYKFFISSLKILIYIQIYKNLNKLVMIPNNAKYAKIGYIDKEYYCATFIQLHSEILSILNTH